MLALALASGCGRILSLDDGPSVAGDAGATGPDGASSGGVGLDSGSGDGPVVGAGDGSSLEAAADSGNGLPGCPPCDGGTCVASGCSGLPAAICNAPITVANAVELDAFVCPQGSPATLASPCGGGGSFPAVVLHLGPYAGTWNVTVDGKEPFIAVGSCSGTEVCSGADSTVSRSVRPNSDVMIGTIPASSSCESFHISISGS